MGYAGGSETWRAAGAVAIECHRVSLGFDRRDGAEFPSGRPAETIIRMGYKSGIE